MNHPAAEIVVIALRKICKLAVGKKHADLVESCKQFIDNIQDIVPSDSNGRNTASATEAINSNPSLQEALKEAADEDLQGQEGKTGIEGSNLATAGSLANQHESLPAAVDLQLRVSSVKAHFEAADLAEAAVVSFESGEGISSSQMSSDLATANVTDNSTHERPSLTSDNASALLNSGVSAVEAVSAAATADLLPDIVPRTDTALPDASCSRILAILRLAVETERPNIIEIALDCIQKLIAFKFLQGAAYAIDLDKQGGMDAGEDGKALHDPSMSTPQAQAVELMCRCDEVPDEGVELQILKGILTATTSGTFTIHGQALLLVVRTCYNIYLMSRSDVNQTTAKACLTQMLNVVFQRMEADCVLVEVKPIMVSDMLGLPRPGPQDGAASMTSSVVQTFLNNVVMVATHGQSPQEIRSSIAASFELRNKTGTSPKSKEVDESSFTQTAEGTNAGLNLIPSSPSAASLSNASDKATATFYPQATTAAEALEIASRTTADEARSNMLNKDAFLVFRALCKLSIRTSDTSSAQDPTAIRGKVLALELLKMILENSGPAFRRGEKFISAIRQYLCMSLLKNIASSVTQVTQLSASIFLTLMYKFRSSLKAEVGVFLPMILLKPFDAPPPGTLPPASVLPGLAAAVGAVPVAVIATRSQTLRIIQDMVKDGQLLVDLFVNYDCDLESSNLFERLVTMLVRVAQQQPISPPPPPLTIDTTNTHHLEQALRQDALIALVNLVQAMLDWHRDAAGLISEDATEEPISMTRTSLTQVSTPAHDTEATSAAAAAGVAVAVEVTSSGGKTSSGGAAHEDNGPSATSSVIAVKEGGDELVAKRAYKLKFQDCIAMFNKKPRKGIEMLQREGMLGTTPSDVAIFLAKTQGLDKANIGDYLGEREEFSLKVMHCYVDAMDFTDYEFDDAIRAFLSGFRLPGEAQKIDRLMEKFAERYVKCNATSFKSADVAYVLAYSVIMLNTDAHNPQVKKKMSKEAFLKNNRGINDGQDLPEDFMAALYDRIVNNEIKMKDDDMLGPATTGSASGPADMAHQARNIFNTLLSLMGATRPQVSNEPSEESIKRTLDFLHEKAKGSTVVTVSEPDAVRPMMEVMWAPLLGALSVLFDEYFDHRLIKYVLSGFVAGCSIMAQVGMSNLRDIFINSLCNFTHLHSPATMKFKNALAFKYLLQVAEVVGDHLQDRWMDILRCISRWELLQQVASGMPTDAVLFSPPEKSGMKAVIEKARRLIKEADLSSGPAIGGEQRGIESIGLSESSLSMRKGSVGVSGASFPGGRKDEGNGIQPEVINSCDSHELNQVFLRSGRLDSEAIVSFVRALCAISLDELRDARAPRVFSLAKIVEIAHYNMTRIRLVWSRIWSVLSDYFITVGCHTNLSVAMYAVDSLRQLAMKFLMRDELANYTFQNDFLRPFVVVMRQSQAVEIRELIIRCLSQMVLARVNNVKSGWKSMFMVFTTAAGDKDPMIVRLAFDTIEKIVREHFSHITETETTTFTDCVNCLIAFTNNPHSLDVALNSIAFLRFCALKLAEGAIGNVNELPEGYTTNPAVHPLRVVAIDGVVRASSLTTPSATAQPGVQDPTSGAAFAHSSGVQDPTSGAAFAHSSGVQDPTSGAAFTHSSGAFASGMGAAAAAAVLADSGEEPLQQQKTLSTVSLSSIPSAGRAKALKFVDKDEHVYFWFPLLAGLSELTFDPRPEIRNSALEVLFDTLKCHGGVFADSFWKRIFDSVLLPIFDHVRAEVTDTTTFTSEKRRQQEDAWLYETCTKCLQHLIDVSVQFYDETRCLLPHLAALLKSFMDRSQQSLAAVGVAAFVRLCNKAGPLMDPPAWEEVTNFLVQVAQEIAPNAMELVTPPSTRPSSMLVSNLSVMSSGPVVSVGSFSSEIQPDESHSDAAYASAAAASNQQPTPATAAARAFSLREGVGARRLAKFRSHSAVQLLLVQGCSETYGQLHRIMPPVASLRLLKALETISTHARNVDMDMDLRKRLAFQQVEDRVPEDRMVVDPPLLRLESESAHAYLSVLTHMVLMSPPQRSPAVEDECAASSRLVELCSSTLRRYVQGVVTPNKAAEALLAGGPLLGRSPATAPKTTLLLGGGLAGVLTGAKRAAANAAAADAAAVVASRSIMVGRSSTGQPVLLATPVSEYTSFTPLVSSVLKALSQAVDEASFKARLPDLFPMLGLMIRADYAPHEVQRALSDLLVLKIGPLIGAPPPPWALLNPSATARLAPTL
ncbi:hypothetical protein CEUSTIGMA_g8046.t1 [Chlamydomonas eustigma]|uniref:SEC7 domain-containing protein n=1 Tax=Chlamydomonas eustigma TaxID=1157962 RepID=A0A250XC05_9CHLO|nr:hypothetical protein CEUSTIGMA_g8046.t1 [Chlamydomonas eustigma]|eukprot:GAX80611.1 hypothetical protein CEUSTIGMA_g8046.t1 [Chlamydomonas eustigma]